MKEYKSGCLAPSIISTCPLHYVQSFLSGSAGVKVYPLYMPLWEKGGYDSLTRAIIILSIAVLSHLCAAFRSQMSSSACGSSSTRTRSTLSAETSGCCVLT